jgi:aryl-alcohol dehydrogenase-like predicted oxidoreductase
MRHRVFGRDGVSVSEVGLGTWQLGSSDWGKVGDETAQAILTEAVEKEITFFDTADVYGPEISEVRIGRFLKTRPERIFVATKLGRFPDPGWPGNFSLESFRKHTEASLRRLDVEALDLTQLHCIPPDRLKQGEVFEWLRTLQREGKIVRFGASVESMGEALLCLEQEGLCSLQIIFNIFRQKPITTLFDKAGEKGVALIVRLPFASGLLTGKFTRDTKFPENDHRHYNRDGQAFNVGETFAGLPFERGVALADELKAMVPQGMTMAQMALRWVLDFEAVSVLIPGATTPKQVRENATASELPPLSAELHQKLRTFYEEKVAEHIRGVY